MIDIAKAAEQHGTAVLRMRTEAEKGLADAEAKGEKKVARKWQSELRKLNKMIADYGLERYAQRT